MVGWLKCFVRVGVKVSGLVGRVIVGCWFLSTAYREVVFRY